MKKIMKKIGCLLLAGCMVIGMGACSSNSETTSSSAPETDNSSVPQTESANEETKASGKSYNFTFVCPIVGLEYWDMCSAGIAAADAEFGTSTQIIGGSDAATMLTDVVNYMEAAISSKPDGLMTYAGMEVFPPLIEKATEHGIPVIAIDSDAPSSSRIAYVGTDPYNAGFSSGEAMIEATGGSAKVAVLTSTLGSEKEAAEIEAFKEAVADKDIEIIATEETNADLNTGVTKMQALVQTYPELSAVLCTSAYDVQAAAKVKVEMGLDDLVLIGYDDQEETLKYIREGVIDGIIVQDPYQMGYQSVKLLKQYIDGEELEKIYDTGTILVNAENVDNYRD